MTASAPHASWSAATRAAAAALLAAAISCAGQTAAAPSVPSDVRQETPSLPPDVFAKNEWTELTRTDYDAALSKLPEKRRWDFATSPRRLQSLLNGLLVTKTLAAQARAHGLSPAALPEAATRGPVNANDAERVLANAELKRVDDDAGKAFDAKKPEFEAKARELYTVDPGRYRRPEEVRFSDIAVSIKDRGDAAAHKRATEAREKIAAGADFATVAREYSDDPSTRDKGGALPFTSAKQLEPDFAKAVFALEHVGEISAPIKGTAAWHVVRIDERRAAGIPPFAEVRDSILKDLRNRYLSEQRDLRIQSIYHDPTLQLNQPAIDALVNHVDYSKFEHPSSEKPGGSPALSTQAPASPTQAPVGGHGEAQPAAAPAAK